MDNKIEVFKNEQFGEVRTILDGETLLFCGSDVARALGYARPGKAIIDHCKGVLKRDTLTSGGTQSLSYITEGDVYRLIVHSKLPSAERFEHWLFDEVVPMIRKTGCYMTESLLDRIQKEPAVIIELAQPKYARNKNILVIGGSGSGKTRFFVKPNLMQMHSSYVVTDPKGTVLVECGKMLEKGGYVIKSLNTINFRKSMHYNPFSYIRSEKDILKLVNTIIVNTKGDGDKSGEDFWVSATRSQAVKSLRTVLVY